MIAALGIVGAAVWYSLPREQNRRRLKRDLVILQQGNMAREKLIAALKKRITDFENNNECKILFARIEGQAVPNEIQFVFTTK